MVARARVLFRQFRGSYRPVAAVLVLLLPMGFVTWGYSSLQRGQVAFSSRERDGLTQLQPLLTLLAETVHAQGRIIDDDPPDDAALVRAVTAVDRVGHRFADELPLPARWPAVRERLVPAGTVPESPAVRLSAARTALVQVIVEVADQSNLTLDPAFSSYYVMATLVVHLPVLMDRTAAAMTEAARIRGDPGTGTGDAQRSLASSGAVLANEQTALSDAMAKAIAGAHDDGLRDLRPVVDAQRGAMQTLIRQIDAATGPVPLQATFAQAVKAQHDLADRLVPPLRSLLDSRITHLYNSAYVINAATLGALLFLGYLLFGVYRSAGERRSSDTHAALIRYAATTANSADTIATAAQDVMREVCTVLGWTAAQLWSTDPGSASWFVAAHPHRDSGGPCGLQQLAADGSAPDGSQVPLAAQTRIAANAGQLPGIRSTAEACGIGAAVAVPVLAGGEAAGMLACYLPAGAPQPGGELVTALEQIGLALGRVVERQRTAAALLHQASHDAVTGLANRWRLMDGLRGAQQQLVAGLTTHRCAVLLINLDRFRLINDAIGYAAGDTALREAAERIRRAADPADCVARLGADEFAVLAHRADPDSGSDGNGPFNALAERLVAHVHGTVNLDGHPFVLHAGVGVRLLTADAAGSDDPAVILRDADTALREAKRRGKDQVRVFDAALRRTAESRLEDEAALAHAVTSGQLVLHHQPVVALQTGRPVGTEALVRWQRPGHGLVPPDRFIALAEETGLIVELGLWVLRSACHDAATWPATVPVLADGTVSVNVSTWQLIHPRFLADLDEAMHDAGLPPHRLILEITESALIEDTETVTGILNAIRLRGVALALDDFGTGYSSLRYLQTLPIDIIKIDKSFVDPIIGAGHGTAMSQVVINLAEATGLRTVAEGVEHPAQADALRELGCQRGQGYTWSRPVPQADLATAVAAIVEQHAKPLSAPA